MLQLKNRTPFDAKFSLFPNEQGIDTLYLMIKASFKIGHDWILTDKQISPFIKDEYWGELNDSSIKYGSDYHIGKSATDIIVMGNAYVPDNKLARQLDVNVSVGEATKTIRVFGDRVWKNGHISPPEPFQQMELVYERAFGGKHERDKKDSNGDGEGLLVEPRNPIGRGFAGKRSLSEMNGIALPNLEDPNDLIKTHKDAPEPACFAFISPSWQNRQQYAGTYDEAWQTGRSPYLPDDFDKRFFNAAHRQLIYPSFLKGGEGVNITHMHPDGDLTFNLPQFQPIAEVDISDKLLRLMFQIETVLIQPNQMELSLVWRASLPCDKNGLKIKDINIVLPRKI